MRKKKIKKEHLLICKNLAMKEDEYWKLVKLLGREPTDTELSMVAALWSEHCSYKSSKIHLKLFPVKGERVLAGPGENAGIIDTGDGKALVFKMESHNHPSFIEPFHGAATGVGGILRDIFTMGARPVAILDSLRFGNFKNKRMQYLLNGVVSGIAFYGNCVGVPTVGGETYFDESFDGNILVNAMCIGIVDKEKIHRAIAKGEGNPVIYVGSKTGRDGIGGATMASEEFDEESEEKRPSVQVGDPFSEKLLIEACLEAFETGLIVGIQDMGAAGLASSSTEMAGKGKVGMKLNLDKVPLREKNMTPSEIMISESQERMLIVAKKGGEKKLMKVFKKWGLDSCIIGNIKKGKNIEIWFKKKKVADIASEIFTEKAPVYRRKMKEPSYLKETKEFDPFSLKEPKDLKRVFEKLLSSPHIASKEPVYEQYDHMVGTDTVVLPGGDAAVLRIKGTGKGFAVTTDCNPAYCYLDPYTGGMQAVVEAQRNLACVGAEPLGVTDCLNFGNPEKSEVMWQFRKSIEGMRDALKFFKIPVVSGNVSFYNENETIGRSIDPTPEVGMVGIVEDLEKIPTDYFPEEGLDIVLIGYPGEELGGSLYLRYIYGIKKGLPPHIDLKAEKRLSSALKFLIKEGLILSAHDVSEGGLAIAVAESCLRNLERPIGAKVKIEHYLRKDAALFGESQCRAIVSTKPDLTYEIFKNLRNFDIPARLLGKTGGGKIHFEGYFSISLKKAYSLWKEGLKKIMM